MLERERRISIGPGVISSFTPPGELVVNTVSECRFAYNDSTVLQRNGLISLWLKLTREGESVSLQQQINVDNTP